MKICPAGKAGRRKNCPAGKARIEERITEDVEMVRKGLQRMNNNGK